MRLGQHHELTVSPDVKVTPFAITCDASVGIAFAATPVARVSQRWSSVMITTMFGLALAARGLASAGELSPGSSVAVATADKNHPANRAVLIRRCFAA